MLQIQSKRFYLDVKQNRRGRFIKVAEVSTSRAHLVARSDFQLTRKQRINSNLCSMYPNVNFMQFHVIQYTQIGADGRRSQIFLALSTAAEFRDHLSTFSDFYSSLGMSKNNTQYFMQMYFVRGTCYCQGTAAAFDKIPMDGVYTRPTLSFLHFKSFFTILTEFLNCY